MRFDSPGLWVQTKTCLCYRSLYLSKVPYSLAKLLNSVLKSFLNKESLVHSLYEKKTYLRYSENSRCSLWAYMLFTVRLENALEVGYDGMGIQNNPDHGSGQILWRNETPYWVEADTSFRFPVKTLANTEVWFYSLYMQEKLLLLQSWTLCSSVNIFCVQNPVL